MSLPVLAGGGSGNAANSAGALTVNWPAGTLVGDIGILILETSNQAITLTTPGDFATVTGSGGPFASSPQSSPAGGGGGADPNTRLTMFWGRASSTSPTSVITSDSGDHQWGTIITFRGCIEIGNPIDAETGDTDDTANTAVTWQGVTTTGPDRLIVGVCTRDNDSTAANFGPTYTSTSGAVTSTTEILDNGTTQQDGGGACAFTGRMIVAGATGTITTTAATATHQARILFALKPAVLIGWQANGTAVNGTGAVTPTWPAHVSGDIALLICESDAEVISLTTASGFTELASSPQTIGVAGVAGTNLAVFWVRATSAAMANPVVGDPGDHVSAQIVTFRGCVGDGSPFDTMAGGTAISATSVSCPAITTGTNGALVVNIVTNDSDTVTAQSSAWANIDLVSCTEVADQNTTAGNGGGFGVAVGIKSTAGSVRATTMTLANASPVAMLTLALKATDDGTVAGTPNGLAPLTLIATGTAQFVTINGTLSKTLGALTSTATATNKIQGVVAETLGVLTGVATGTGKIQGTVSKTLGTLTGTATGTGKIQGTVSKTLGILTGVATGTNKIQGVEAATLGVLTAAATGSSTLHGTVAATLGALTITATGTESIVGVVLKTLGTLTSASTGKVLGQGTVAATLGALAASAAAASQVRGVVATTLGTLTASATAASQIRGVVATTLGTLTSVATAHNIVHGSADIQLGTATSAPPIQGVIDATLGALTGVAAGTGKIRGVVASVLGVLTSAATGTIAAHGTVSKILGILTSAATAAITAHGTLAKTLGTLTSTSSGVEPVRGVVATTLGTLTSTGTGTISIRGTVAKTLGALTSTSTTIVASRGTVSQTLAALTGTATGQTPSHGTLAKTLGTLTGSSSGTVTTHGVASQILGTLTGAATGTVAIHATLSRTLGTLTGTSAGSSQVTASLAATLGTLTLNGAGFLAPLFQNASGNFTLDTIAITATGTVSLRGTVAATLGALTSGSTATIPGHGTVSKTLGALTGTSSGIAYASGTLVKTLGALTGASSGTATTHGATSRNLGALTGAATGTVRVAGSVAATLGAATGSAAATSKTHGVVESTLGTLVASSTGIIFDRVIITSYYDVLPTASYRRADLILTEGDHMSFQIKQGDLLPSMSLTLSSDSDFDLDDATAITFVWRPKDSSERHTHVITTFDATAKTVLLDWVELETEATGYFDAQVEVTFTTRVMTFPNAGFFTFEVEPTI